MKPKSIPTVAALIALSAAFSTTSFAYSGEEFAKETKITMEEATKIALKARPGEVTDKELEHEKGGSGLRYSFDIKSGGVTYEVGVDAKTGKVLENDKEGPNPD